MVANLPKITIVTPCLNDLEFVGEMLASIHDQGYQNLEHIVIDGGSRDGSLEIIRRYTDRLSWWCSEPDGGHGDALAKGFAHASGDIMTWICSDDILLPGALSAVAQHFSLQPHCRWLTGGGLIIDAQGKVIDHVFATSISHTSMLFWQFWGAVQPAMFFSRKAFQEAGGVNRSFDLSPDLDLCLRVARNGASDRLNTFLGALRLYPNTQTARRRDEMRLVDSELRRREGYLNYPPPIRTLLYQFYNQRFIAGQRWRKLLMHTRIDSGGGYERGQTWNPY